MRLSQPFYRLPVRFDIARLQEEVRQLPAESWNEHPNGIAGNSALRLISAGGGENDDVDGVMQPTAHLKRTPYLRQVLASLGVVWSRSRLMQLAPHSDVPEHADINYHWYYRVRVHIPIFTTPGVLFHCGDETVHMAAGEAWIFDNWRRHRVLNDSEESRIHLVGDTAGNSAFWQLVAQGQAGAAPLQHRFDPNRDVQLLTERTTLAPVMAPAEIDLLLLDLRAELTAADRAAPDDRPHHCACGSTWVCSTPSAAIGASSTPCTANAPRDGRNTTRYANNCARHRSSWAKACRCAPIASPRTRCSRAACCA